MLEDALYMLAKIETATGKTKLKYLRQLHLLVETSVIVERIRLTA